MCSDFFYCRFSGGAEMEKVENTETSQVYENDMELYLSQFCKDQKIEDIRQESQSVWNAALMYIKRHAFNDPDCLKSKEMHNIDGFLGGYSNYNAYNYKLINRICDYYIYMCMMYDKEVSAIGFSLLTGIDRYTIATWRDEGTKSSPLSSDIGKKIADFREESLSAKLATAKRNPVGILAILNRHYGWNLPGVSREQQNHKQALTASDLPQLGGANGQNISMLTDSGAYDDSNIDANE
jgi:hypothetical protein